MAADLTQLAGLMALARDPDASTRAREFLYQQKLQADQMAAAERLESARMSLQESQFNRSQELAREQQTQTLGQRASEFAATEARQKEEFGISSGLQRDQLTATGKYQDEQIKLAKQELELKKQANAQDAVNKIMDQIKASNAKSGTRLSPADYLEAVGKNPQLSTVFAAMVSGPEKGKKGQLSRGDAEAMFAHGFAAADAATGGVSLTPSGAGMANIQSLIQVGTAALDDETRAMVMDRLKNLGPAAVLDVGGTLSPEQLKQATADLGSAIGKVTLEGNKLDYKDQVFVSKLWNSLPDSAAKTEVLTSSIAAAAIQIQAQRGLSDEQTAKVQEELTAALVAATDPENDRPLIEVTLPIFDAIGDVGPQPPSRLGVVPKGALSGGIRSGLEAIGGAGSAIGGGIGSFAKDPLGTLGKLGGGPGTPSGPPAGERVKQGLQFGGTVAKQGEGGEDSPFNYGGRTSRLTPIQQRQRDRSLGKK